MFEFTYRTVTTLLTEVSFPSLVLDLFCFLELPDASVHALGHVVVGCVLWLRHVQKLEGQFTDTVRRASNNATTLALDTARASIINSPFVEARNVDCVGTTVGLTLVVVEADIGTCERAIRTDQVVEKIPSSGLVVTLSCSLSLLLLLKRQAISLLLCLALLLLPLLW